MTTFIMFGTYSADAIHEISSERTREAVEIVGANGGKLVATYALMGDVDLLAITEFPGINEAVKTSIALTKALGISFSTVPALKVEEFDKLLGA